MSQVGWAMRGIHHTGITVSDLDRSVDWYREVLELEMLTEPSAIADDPELGAGVGVPGAALRMATFAVGPDVLELLEYAAPPSPVEAPVPQNALGAHHVALRVDDIEAAYERLTAKGVTFFSAPNAIDEGLLAGWRWAYFTDPDGITLELVEVAYSRPEDERRAGVEAYLAARGAARSTSEG
jgi:catechol 2,3-dioxygenase-like lactoylglutathione lyase family enzyme